MLRPVILGIAAIIALGVGYKLTAQNPAPKDIAPKATVAKASKAGGCCPTDQHAPAAATPVAAEGAACPFSGGAAVAAEKCGDKCDTLVASMEQALTKIAAAKASNDSKQMAAALDLASAQLTTAKAQIAACLAAKGATTAAAPAAKADGAACCPSTKTAAVE